MIKALTLVTLLSTSMAHAFTVEVRDSQANPIQLSVDALGTVESALATDVRTRAEGLVERIYFREGDQVSAGDSLILLSDDDQSLNLERARGEYRRLTLEFERAQSLFDQKLQPKSAVDAAQSALKSAETQLANARLAVEHRQVTAPFDGVVSELHVEEGAVVGKQAAVLRLIDPNQVKIILEVPQQDVAQMAIGQNVKLNQEGALPALGRVTRVASVAQGATRMFEVEVKPVSNTPLRPGMSVAANVQVSESSAHFVSPAWLFLDDQGAVGVKAVDDENRVQFYPVDLVRADAEGFYVAGLPESLRIISVGGGFVKTGTQVTVANP